MENKVVKHHTGVFVTKKFKLRARVEEIFEDGSKMSTEVTVGGESWKDGKLSKYHSEILSRCRRVLIYMDKNLKKVEGE